MASPESFAGRLSPFRPGFLRVDLFYDGAWQDVTADLSRDGVTIERSGRDTTECTLSLRNDLGKYSPRNPRSPLFGKIGRNTPLRVSTQMLAGGPVSYRFTGEVSEWPQRWGRKGAPSAYSPVVASGILRRLGQGAAPLRSPLYRGCATIAGLRAYWPLEDAEGATEGAAGIPGIKGMRVLSAGPRPAFASYDGFVASEPVPVIGTARLRGTVPTYTNTGVAQVRFVVLRPAALPDTNSVVRINFRGGTISRIDLGLYATTVGREVWDRDDNKLNGTTTAFDYAGKNTRMGVEVEQNGADVRYRIRFLDEGSLVGLVGAWVTLTGQTLGTVSSVEVNPTGAALTDVAIGHVTVQDTTGTIADVAEEFAAHVGEKAADRIARLCTENGVSIATTGGKPLAEKMGPQGVETLLSLVDEALDTGQGILRERRDAAGLQYRTIEDLYNETPALAVSYVDNLFRPFEPTDDDDGVRNKVTVQRAGGASATVERITGPLSTLAPPNGVGVYDEQVTLSLDLDARTEGHAGWRVNLGTHDEPRWPVIGVDLADSYWLARSSLTAAALSVDLGDVITIDSLPSWLPPDQIRVMVTGYTETIRPHEYTIEWETVPARPYTVGTYSTGSGPARYTSAGTVTAEDLDATETDVDITHGARKWGRPDGDYDVVIGGERMTVKAVTDLTLPAQRFTVVRGVNGVSKAHASGASVELAEPYRYAL